MFLYEGSDPLFDITPETAGLLVLGLILIVLTIALRWVLKREKTD